MVRSKGTEEDEEEKEGEKREREREDSAGAKLQCHDAEITMEACHGNVIVANVRLAADLVVAAAWVPDVRNVR